MVTAAPAAPGSAGESRTNGFSAYRPAKSLASVGPAADAGGLPQGAARVPETSHSRRPEGRCPPHGPWRRRSLSQAGLAALWGWGLACPSTPKSLGVQGRKKSCREAPPAPLLGHHASPGAQAVQHRVVDRVKDPFSRANFTVVLAGWTFTSTAVTGSVTDRTHPGNFALHDLVAVALLQRRRQKLGLDEPAIDEKHLHGAGAPALEGHGNIALHRHLSAPALHGQQARAKAQGVDRGLQLPVAGGVERLGAVL